ncbi:hypothetical protein EMIT0P12_50157 [Pseudomonas sp. IT-P12]
MRRKQPDEHRQHQPQGNHHAKTQAPPTQPSAVNKRLLEARQPGDSGALNIEIDLHNTPMFLCPTHSLLRYNKPREFFVLRPPIYG